MVADIKAFMANDSAREAVDKIEAVIDTDQETCKLLDLAQSVEDVFEATKKYVAMKLEDFKALFADVMDYFKADKAVLADETLDCVVGGWSWGGIWETVKRKAVAVVVGAAIGGAVLGITGAALGGPIGFGVGAVVGGIAGGIIGGIVG